MEVTRDREPLGQGAYWHARFSVLPEVYFSGFENVTEFLEVIDNQIRLPKIPSDLSCAYLKGLSHREGLRLASDIRVKRRGQEPTDFIYNLLKLHKQQELGMSVEASVDYIFVRLEPQVQNFVEVQIPQNTVHLSDHPLALGQNQIESLKCVGKRLLRNSDRLTLGLEDRRGRLGRFEDIELIKQHCLRTIIMIYHNLGRKSKQFKQ
ncbi:uncharacterized protein TNCV_3983591 [Trichonephila clavipes]|nr:uncharacterized protein TNCV_3983591 [Trichonephila clavipes]